MSDFKRGKPAELAAARTNGAASATSAAATDAADSKRRSKQASSLDVEKTVVKFKVRFVLFSDVCLCANV
jgi:hypothetical protein